MSIFVLDTKMKEDNKIVLQRVGFKISRERQGLLLQSRKMAKRRQSFGKPTETTMESVAGEKLQENSRKPYVVDFAREVSNF